MNIVIDDRIPFIRGIFEPHAEVLYLPGTEIRREHLLDADCLLIRTRTRCNQKLLEGTRVKFIGTATIGFDHIDTNWCESNGITWTNAPGCNSGSVAQYITAALFELASRQHFNLKDKTLGIIGVGNVGKKVEKIARVLGMRVILNDPPRERTGDPANFTDLPALLQNADIITIHVPLNREEPDKTLHMVDRHFLHALKPGAILINSSRGEVLDEEQVVSELRGLREPMGGLVLDVWENEPDINRELMVKADIATPHIAGYSVDGKYNATKMISAAVCREFGWPEACLTTLEDVRLNLKPGFSSLVTCHAFVQAAYNILADDNRLRESPETFEKQRNNYPVRREFSACSIEPFPEGETGRILTGLGFQH